MQPGGSEIFSVACELFAVAHVGTFLTRVQTQTPCIGGSECQPLDHQGSALNFLSFDASLCIFISQPHPQHTHTHTHSTVFLHRAAALFAVVGFQASVGESVICTFLAALLIASCSDSVNQAREVNPFSSGLPRYNLRPRAVKVDCASPTQWT